MESKTHLIMLIWVVDPPLSTCSDKDVWAGAAPIFFLKWRWRSALNGSISKA
jgi:hypothetical protein